ncbi:MAG: hypothetical protein NT171_16340 [Planctomycetota bacterium]|nr:hypothetical protein [Planctomycetota bacterium]
MKTMTRPIFGRRSPRGVSLVELLMAMGGLSLVITSSAMLLHGVMRAQSESRRFFDDERTSARLARVFRADVHAAAQVDAHAAAQVDAQVAALAGERLVAFTLPDGGTIEYRHTADRRQIQRRLLTPGNEAAVAREDYSFASAYAAVVTVAQQQIHLELGAEGADGALAPPGVVRPPRTPAEAKRKPPALVVEADLGRDLRFLAARDGEARP